MKRIRGIIRGITGTIWWWWVWADGSQRKGYRGRGGKKTSTKGGHSEQKIRMRMATEEEEEEEDVTKWQAIAGDLSACTEYFYLEGSIQFAIGSTCLQWSWHLLGASCTIQPLTYVCVRVITRAWVYLWPFVCLCVRSCGPAVIPECMWSCRRACVHVCSKPQVVLRTMFSQDRKYKCSLLQHIAIHCGVALRLGRMGLTFAVLNCNYKILWLFIVSTIYISYLF